MAKEALEKLADIFVGELVADSLKESAKKDDTRGEESREASKEKAA